VSWSSGSKLLLHLLMEVYRRAAKITSNLDKKTSLSQACQGHTCPLKRAKRQPKPLKRLFSILAGRMRHETVRRHDPQSRHLPAAAAPRLVSATGLQVTESPWPSDSGSDVDSTAAVRPGGLSGVSVTGAPAYARPGRSGSEPRLPSEPECAGAAVTGGL
jgi:hypothetical protein